MDDIKTKKRKLETPKDLFLHDFDKNTSHATIKKTLNELNLEGLVRYNKPRKKPGLFLVFDSVENQQKAFQKLEEMKKWKIDVVESKMQKRQKIRPITEVVTPLAYLKYEDQLKKKEMNMQNILIHKLFDVLCTKWKTENEIPKYIQEANTKQFQQEKEKLDFFIKWEGIVPSAVVNGYRNNCEFTCGFDQNGEKSVGFLLGRFVKGLNMVASPDECLNISDNAKEACREFQKFIRASELDVYDKTNNQGFWRLLKFRENVKGEVLLMVQVNETGVENVNDIKKQVVEFFRKTKLNIVSIWWQNFTGVSNAAPPDTPIEKIYGEDCLYEYLFDLKFRISPTSFFQVNTKGAEVLYKIAAEWASANKDQTLLDVCCGTGTIGITMAKSVKRVIGIEMVQSAVDDAIKNAKLNNIQNAHFICGKAEEKLQQVLIDPDISKGALAIVDPPRGGLHPKVLKAIMKCTAIQRLVYVSCNPNTMAENAVMICGPPSKKTGFAKPVFKAIRAIAVDLFPHTEHCEMIVLFERLTNEKT